MHLLPASTGSIGLASLCFAVAATLFVATVAISFPETKDASDRRFALITIGGAGLVVSLVSALFSSLALYFLFNVLRGC
jgi:hypothetical protein